MSQEQISKLILGSGLFGTAVSLTTIGIGIKQKSPGTSIAGIVALAIFLYILKTSPKN